MVVVLYVIGALTVLAGFLVGVNILGATRSGNGLVALYMLGGALTSMLWFALAAILNRQNEIFNLLKLTSVTGGASGELGGQVVVLSLERHGSTPAFIRSRLERRSETLKAYGSLQEAVEGEWEHFSTVAEGESLHQSVEEAQTHAKAMGVKGYAHPVTPAALRREIEWLMPRLRR